MRIELPFLAYLACFSISGVGFKIKNYSCIYFISIYAPKNSLTFEANDFRNISEEFAKTVPDFLTLKGIIKKMGKTCRH